MTFNSLSYFIFLPLVFLVFYVTKDRSRWVVLLAASYGFYATFKAPELLLALVLVTVISFTCGTQLSRTTNESRRKLILWMGITLCILILAVIKYLPLLVNTQPSTSIFVSIGVSYFTFQAISYLADIFLEIQDPEHHLGYHALYLAFFPKLLQGPIERAHALLPQLKQPYRFDYDSMRYGILLFTWGLFKKVVDMAFAGGLAREDHIFKALALGAPFTKLICMGRAVMIPGFLGSNIEGVLIPDRKEIVCGHWEKLPNNVTESGTNSPAEIFAGYYDVEKKVGKSEMKNIPYGAIAVWTLADKLAAGLQQFMAGARKFSLSSISRDDLYSGNRETEAETGIPFITDVGDKKARKILQG